MWSLPICPIATPLPNQALKRKSRQVDTRLEEIKDGLESMAQSTKDNTALVQREFAVLIEQILLRKRTLMEELSAIAADKAEMLEAQAQQLEQYQCELAAELAKDRTEMDAAVAARDVSLVTAPSVELSIDGARLRAQISAMCDLQNLFAAPAPSVTLHSVKAHTCTVRLGAGACKYGGFAAATQLVVQIAFGPKRPLAEDETVDASALKWKQIARRDVCAGAGAGADSGADAEVKVKKLKPGTLYFVRAKAKNEFGWSAFCAPAALATLPLKIDTAIMSSDEIEALMDLVHRQRQRQSSTWRLLFRGSRDGFLASTFHLQCDGHGDTVCVIESDCGNVFGAFTALPWKSDVGRYRVDEEAFVCIVRKKHKALDRGVVYLQYTSSQHSVVHNKYMGPVFGYGHDIYIRNKCDEVDDNSCRNHTYQCSYAAELAGKEKFRVVNYEVFQISHPEDDEEW